jgi:hypothetical protein
MAAAMTLQGGWAVIILPHVSLRLGPSCSRMVNASCLQTRIPGTAMLLGAPAKSKQGERSMRNSIDSL